MADLVQIDGSFGEGGGQILRTSVSLSAITGKPVEIANIRGKRSKPGLQPQHLAAVRAAGMLCGAKLTGDAVGSQYLLFEPLHEPGAGEYLFDIGTAGATTLVAQTVIVPLSLAGGQSRVTVRGGTHNPMAPTADYLEHVYAATLSAHGYRFSATYDPPGFYPRGGGELRIEIAASESLGPVVLTEPPSHILPPVAYVVTNSLAATVADRAEEVLSDRLSCFVEKRVESRISTGAAVTIVTEHAGFSALGERGKPMERVAEEAIEAALRWSDSRAAVDEHLADQLVLPALFASGPSAWKTSTVTEHLRTVLWVAEHFCDFSYTIEDTTIRLSPSTS